MEGLFLVLCFLALRNYAVESRCEDGYGDCRGWAARGDCEVNPGFMLHGCPVSCGQCGKDKTPILVAPTALDIENCKDTNENCAVWAAHGECHANPRYMLVQCATSCKVCKDEEEETTTECKDENEYCPAWASHEQCQLNPGYMLEKCQKSCSVCGEARNEEEESYKTEEQSVKTEEVSRKSEEESKKKEEESGKTEEESESSEETSEENVAKGGSSISALIGNLILKHPSKTILRS